MSKVSVESNQGPFLFLEPSMIEVDESVNVRPYSTSHESSERDVEELQRLIRSIEEHGQEQPVIVRENGGEKFKLIAGNRRLRAIETINIGREVNDQIQVQAVVLPATVDPLRAAFDENDKRQAMSPMDKALNFKTVRELNKWTGAKGDKKVAEYFGVNVATVVQYRKLEGLGAEIQERVHSGILTMDAAMIIAKMPTEDQEQVVISAEVHERERMAKDGETEAENAVITGVPGRSKK